jgi:hypothetical protein
VQYGKVTWDDLSANNAAPYFYNQIDQPGKVNVLMTDADNYLIYSLSHGGDAFNVQTDVQSGVAAFSIPNNNIWYAFLDNSSHVATGQLVTGVMLYEHYGVANEDNIQPAAAISLSSSYPNPFNQEASISFNLPKSTKADLAIYNTKGQKVKTLLNGNQKAGVSKVIWNGIDDNGTQVSNGIYYYRLQTGTKTLTHKLILLK